jgi:histidinol-phosphate aminotransferase
MSGSPLKLRPGIADAPIYVPGAHGEDDPALGPPAVLSANENPLGPSTAALDAYRDSAALHRYPDGGAVALRQAIGARFGLDPERIVCGAGSDELITLLIRCYAGDGDEVLQSRHGFLMYAITARTVGATPVLAPETDLHADVDQLLAHVTEKTRICFVANPNNPTGTRISGADLRRLREGLRDDILLAVDAAYSEYVDDPAYSDGSDLVDDFDNVVMLRTFSKIFGLAALRLGWCYAPAAVVDALNRVRSPFNVSAAAQAAGLAAVRDTDHIARSVSENAQQRKRLTGALRQFGLTVPDSAGNFVLARFADAETAAAANAFLAERGVIVRAVAAYGLPESLRMTVGTGDENDRLIAALGAFMNR